MSLGSVRMLYFNLGGAVQYDAPRVQVFGTFRDLTLVGATGSNDVLSVAGAVSGCAASSDPDDCIRAS